MEPAPEPAVATWPDLPAAAGWREAERQVFQELDRLLREGVLSSCADDKACFRWNRIGESGTAAHDAARRSGYFAEFAALLLRAPHRAELLAWSEAAHSQLRSALGPVAEWPPLAAVPGGRAREVTGLDELAARWRISPPLDRARFLSERPSLSAL